MNQSRPIYQYSTDELKEIVLKTIIESGLGCGYYYDEQTNQSIKIEINTRVSRYHPGKYLIHYKNGFTEVVFSVDTITERRSTA